MNKVKDKKLLFNFGDNLLNEGFTSIPNILLNYQKELDLTNDELLFYIKIYSKNKSKITDEEIGMKNSRTTYFRIRKSLENKKYLKITQLYQKNEKGKIISIGINYDFSGLILACKNLPMFQIETADIQNETADTTFEQADIQNETYSKKNILKELIKEYKEIYNSFLLNYYSQNDINLYIWQEKKQRNCLHNLFGKFKTVNEFKTFLEKCKNDNWIKTLENGFLPAILLSQFSRIGINKKNISERIYTYKEIEHEPREI